MTSLFRGVSLVLIVVVRVASDVRGLRITMVRVYRLHDGCKAAPPFEHHSLGPRTCHGILPSSRGCLRRCMSCRWTPRLWGGLHIGLFEVPGVASAVQSRILELMNPKTEDLRERGEPDQLSRR
jgi:hypothetical protein